VTALGAGTHHGCGPPTWVVGLVLWLLPQRALFDLTRYLRVHFTKVAAQTRLMLDGWIAKGSPMASSRDPRPSMSYVLPQHARKLDEP
jgi:hypothetical protein